MCTKRFRNSTVKHAFDFNTTTGQSMGVTTFDLETVTGKLSNKAIQRCAMFSFFLSLFFFFFLNFLFLSGLRHKISYNNDSKKDANNLLCLREAWKVDWIKRELQCSPISVPMRIPFPFCFPYPTPSPPPPPFLCPPGKTPMRIGVPNNLVLWSE